MNFAFGIVIAFGAVGFADLVAIDRATRLAVFCFTGVFAGRGVVSLHNAGRAGIAGFFDELAVATAIIAFGAIRVATAFIGILVAGCASNGTIAGFWSCAARAFDFSAGRRTIIVGTGDRVNFTFGIVIALGAVSFANLVAIDRTAGGAVSNFTGVFTGRGIVALDDAGRAGVAVLFDELAVIAAIITLGTIRVTTAFIGILIAGCTGNRVIAGFWGYATRAFDFTAGRRTVIVGARDRVDFAFGIVIAFRAVGFANLVAIGRTAGSAVGNFTGIFAGRGIVALDNAGRAGVAVFFDELAVIAAIIALGTIRVATALVSAGIAGCAGNRVIAWIGISIIDARATRGIKLFACSRALRLNSHRITSGRLDVVARSCRSVAAGCAAILRNDCPIHTKIGDIAAASICRALRRDTVRVACPGRKITTGGTAIFRNNLPIDAEHRNIATASIHGTIGVIRLGFGTACEPQRHDSQTNAKQTLFHKIPPKRNRTALRLHGIDYHINNNTCIHITTTFSKILSPRNTYM